MTPLPEQNLKKLQNALNKWYEKAKRDLPWRRTKDPYAIWISEVMLQQTTVQTVWNRWIDFLEKYPTVSDLAAVQEDELLAQWSGLGYYARARNLLKAARMIDQDLGGKLPSEFELLLALPGMGHYTAAAVSSIAFNQPVAVLDANVERVLTRWEACSDNIRQPKIKRMLWDRAQVYLTPKNAGDWNQAMMELGATICLPKRPICSVCPVSKWCHAFELGSPEAYPVKTPKKPMKEVREAAVLLRQNGKVLLLQRPSKGSFANMWETPRGIAGDQESRQDAARRILKEQTGLEAKIKSPIFEIKHVVMNSKIHLQVFAATLIHQQELILSSHVVFEWVSEDEWVYFPLSTTQKKLAQSILGDPGKINSQQSDDSFFDQ